MQCADPANVLQYVQTYTVPYSSIVQILWRRWKKGGNALAHKIIQAREAHAKHTPNVHTVSISMGGWMEWSFWSTRLKMKWERVLFITSSEAIKARSIQFQKNVSHEMSCRELKWYNVIRSTLNVSSMQCWFMISDSSPRLNTENIFSISLLIQ